MSLAEHAPAATSAEPALPLLSVVVATYNRGPILEKCLKALQDQELAPEQYEIVVVDDGSTDDTPDLVSRLQAQGGPGWVYHWQVNAGRSRARNVGIDLAQGRWVVFIDSDVVVTPDFLATHLRLHQEAGARKVYVQGLAVNTDCFDDPTATPVRPTDVSAAQFATNNVSVAREALLTAGGFDEGFTEYGWEDLELGLRLHAIGYRILRTRAARGFHWHPRFSMADMAGMRRIEEERGRMAAYFHRLHPTWNVRMMIQLTPLHRALDWLVRLGGWLDEDRAAPVIAWLLAHDHPRAAQQLASVLLNHHNLEALNKAMAQQAGER